MVQDNMAYIKLDNNNSCMYGNRIDWSTVCSFLETAFKILKRQCSYSIA